MGRSQRAESARRPRSGVTEAWAARAERLQDGQSPSQHGDAVEQSFAAADTDLERSRVGFSGHGGVSIGDNDGSDSESHDEENSSEDERMPAPPDVEVDDDPFLSGSDDESDAHLKMELRLATTAWARNRVPRDNGAHHHAVVEYRQLCRQYNCVPVTNIEAALAKDKIDLPCHGLGAKGGRALAATLRQNGTVEALLLSNNGLLAEGAASIAKACTDNPNIKKLDLSRNGLRSAGLRAISDAIKTGVALEELILDHNRFLDLDSSSFAAAIQNAKTIHTISLAHNRFGDVAAGRFAAALRENHGIKVLDLSWNCIRQAGAITLARMLPVNQALTSFNLSHNHVGDAGAAAFGQAISANSCLQRLMLDSTEIGDAGAVALASGLSASGLTQLSLQNNPITATGAKALREAGASSLDLNLQGTWESINDHVSSSLEDSKKLYDLANDMALRLALQRDSGAASTGRLRPKSGKRGTLPRNNMSSTSEKSVNAEAGVSAQSRNASAAKAGAESAKTAKGPSSKNGVLGDGTWVLSSQGSAVQGTPHEVNATSASAEGRRGDAFSATSVGGSTSDRSATASSTGGRGRAGGPNYGDGQDVMDEVDERTMAYIRKDRRMSQTFVETHPDLEDPMIVFDRYVVQNRLRLVDLFYSLDKDRSGTIDPDEMMEALDSFGIPLNEIQREEFIHRLDLDGDGTINYQEFVTARRVMQESARAGRKGALSPILAENA